MPYGIAIRMAGHGLEAASRTGWDTVWGLRAVRAGCAEAPVMG
ncbi:hypothetical protein [Streptosporangium saharense]